MSIVRPPAVAGLFYPGQADVLRGMVRRMLDENAPDRAVSTTIKALVVPHAGLVYSGPVAAKAYNLLIQESAKGHRWTRVMILGPNHRVPLHGVAAPDAELFATPTGSVSVDVEGLAELERRFDIQIRPDVHRSEHCLEVQLPFLNEILPAMKLLPLVVGQTSAERVAEIIEWAWAKRDILVVISSDLSHYHPYDEARAIDGDTDRDILALQAEIRSDQACGAYAVNGLMLAARRAGLSIERVDLRNSGDTAGGKDQVVGYGSYVLY